MRGAIKEAPEILAKIPKLWTASNQSTIDCGNTCKIKSREFENILESFISHTELPLLLVESQSLKNLVCNSNSRTPIPSQKSLKDDIMNEYLNTKSVIKEQLSNVRSNISLTLDI